MARNAGIAIGFLSTRFAGTDGVSLESAQWAQVLWDHRHVSFWYAGRLDRGADVSHCVPEAHFGHPENVWINNRLVGRSTREPLVSRRIRDLAEYLKETIYAFVEQFDLRILIVENASSIPMHIPLGLAVAEFLAETGFPAVAHHHDFYWERTRYLVHAAGDYLELAFPPRVANLQHVTINHAAREELSWRKGVASLLVPNVFDFEHPPPGIDDYASDVREQLGLAPDDRMVLQPTRVVPRKGIEHAIKLVQMLDDPRIKLVVSHESGDEGEEYRHVLAEIARESNVDLRFVDTRVGETRGRGHGGHKVYTLWDLYPHADLVTYPSLYEGFGNAFLEAVYFRVPVLINRYAIFARDIEPRGFRLPVMDGYLTRATVEEVRRLLDDADYRQEATAHNYNVAARFYSYRVLRRALRTLVSEVTGA